MERKINRVCIKIIKIGNRLWKQRNQLDINLFGLIRLKNKTGYDANIHGSKNKTISVGKVLKRKINIKKKVYKGIYAGYVQN